MNGVKDGAVRHPKIYVWTDDDHTQVAWTGDRDGTGLVKVGFTDRDVHARIRESRGVRSPTAQPYQLLLTETAVTETGEVFRDHSVHAQLVHAGATRAPDADGNPTEWFEANVEEVRAAIAAVRSGLQLDRLTERKSFPLRDEQCAAVDQTARYFREHVTDGQPPHFLWNAKMRFGKTFTAYQLARKMGWTRVLVLTYKPAVEASWRADLHGHVDFDGWRFKGSQDEPADLDDPTPLVWFASFQDVLGADDDGNPKAKNEDLYLATWDIVIIDEYHFGAWRDAARALYVKDLGGDPTERSAQQTPDVEHEVAAADVEAAFSRLQLDVRHYLYLSGTPFRALTQGEFLEAQVFNWTYADEQRAKFATDDDSANPHAALPTMHLFAYQMPDQLRQVALNNASQFSLTEFFRTERAGDDPPRFVHETEVQKWLDLLRGQDVAQLWSSVSNKVRPPLPYEDTSLLVALQHTVWYLPSVDACLAMRDLLTAAHNTFFRDYSVVVAAGPGVGMGAKALPPVEHAIGSVPQDSKSITLSCGKLLSGVTVPPWAGILMLRELKSPETYFQAAFRVQSPWTSTIADAEVGGEQELIHKHDCFVIDFSPNRALQLVVDYATKLDDEVASERDEEKAVEEFLEFLPVLVFEGYGMSQLQAADVIDYLTRGTSASMLARRWNSSELITLDLPAMETLLADDELVSSLEQVEMFRNLHDDLTAMISTNKELKQKQVSDEKLDEEDKKHKKEAADRRETLRKRLQHFVTRIPAFMYLTDDRETAIKDIITQHETEMFEQVTGLTLTHFHQLVDAGVFDDGKMNDAVWKFKEFEDPSLDYTSDRPTGHLRGGWTLVRDERLAQLIDQQILNPGDELIGARDGLTAVVTEDYGLAVNGVRYATPEEAAAAGGITIDDGWAYWQATTPYGDGSLADLLEFAYD
jgi:hypothetical protein